MERNWELQKRCLECGNLSVSVSLALSKLISLVFLNHPEIPDSQASATRGSNRVLITDLHHSLYLHGNTAPQILQLTFFSGISESSHVGSPMCIQTRGSLFIPNFCLWELLPWKGWDKRMCVVLIFSSWSPCISPFSLSNSHWGPE